MTLKSLAQSSSDFLGGIQSIGEAVSLPWLKYKSPCTFCALSITYLDFCLHNTFLNSSGTELKNMLTLFFFLWSIIHEVCISFTYLKVSNSLFHKKLAESMIFCFIEWNQIINFVSTTLKMQMVCITFNLFKFRSLMWCCSLLKFL